MPCIASLLNFCSTQTERYLSVVSYYIIFLHALLEVKHEIPITPPTPQPVKHLPLDYTAGLINGMARSPTNMRDSHPFLVGLPERLKGEKTQDKGRS